MTYSLERQQKERRALFEEEMQRRIQYLDAVVQMSNWSYYFTHLHTRQTKPQKDDVGNRLLTTLDVTPPIRVEDKTAENTHLPNDLGEWLKR